MQGLVSAHLERINARVFEQFQDVITQLVSKQHGVYALYKGDHLYYVGLATDLKGRLKQHLKDQHSKRWDRFSLFLTHTDEHLKELETLAIHIAHPRGNVQHGKFARSQNLRSELKKLLNQKVKGIFAAGKPGDMKAKVKSKPNLKAIGGKNSHWKKIPPLHGLLPPNTQLRAIFKGKEYTATVNDEGRIIIDGFTFNSPSVAASEITKNPKDGWIFWSYKDRAGSWVKLSELKKKLPAV